MTIDTEFPWRRRGKVFFSQIYKEKQIMEEINNKTSDFLSYHHLSMETFTDGREEREGNRKEEKKTRLIIKRHRNKIDGIERNCGARDAI
jgi:hypothetical protein